MPTFKYIFQIKHTEAILSNSTWKLLWFEISKTLTGLKNKFTVLFIIIFGQTFVPYSRQGDARKTRSIDNLILAPLAAATTS